MALAVAPGLQRTLQRSCCVPAVYAQDGGLPPNLSKATVRITVGDENDHTPQLESESCSVEVPENQSRVALYTLRATDPDGDENGRLEYRVAGESPGTRGTLQLRSWRRVMAVHHRLPGVLGSITCGSSCSTPFLSCPRSRVAVPFRHPLIPLSVSPGSDLLHTSLACSGLWNLLIAKS